jgi:hypothetical protein
MLLPLENEIEGNRDQDNEDGEDQRLMYLLSDLRMSKPLE